MTRYCVNCDRSTDHTEEDLSKAVQLRCGVCEQVNAIHAKTLAPAANMPHAAVVARFAALIESLGLEQP